MNTHQHFDLFRTPHTLNPDRLAQSKRAPTFETMTEKKVLTDGNRTIELHHLLGSGHNEGLVVAYLPKEKILVEADSYRAHESSWSVDGADNRRMRGSKARRGRGTALSRCEARRRSATAVGVGPRRIG